MLQHLHVVWLGHIVQAPAGFSVAHQLNAVIGVVNKAGLVGWRPLSRLLEKGKQRMVTGFYLQHAFSRTHEKAGAAQLHKRSWDVQQLSVASLNEQQLQLQLARVENDCVGQFLVGGQVAAEQLHCAE